MLDTGCNIECVVLDAAILGSGVTVAHDSMSVVSGFSSNMTVESDGEAMCPLGVPGCDDEEDSSVSAEVTIMKMGRHNLVDPKILYRRHGIQCDILGVRGAPMVYFPSGETIEIFEQSGLPYANFAVGRPRAHGTTTKPRAASWARAARALAVGAGREQGVFLGSSARR